MASKTLLSKKYLNIVGIMSGTSLDGIDYVLCKYNTLNHSIQFLDLESVSFPKSLQESLHGAANNQVNIWSGAELHFKLGEFYAKKLKTIALKNHWKVDLIGVHGQTVYHHGTKSTLQLGEPSFLAKEFSCPVVSNFRSRDIAAHGEGAPLAPIFHKALLGSLLDKKPMAFHNLGGISNLTWLSKKAKSTKLISFDTGPANMLLDMNYRRLYPRKSGFDKGGALAAKGICQPRLLNKMLDHPYFSKKHPKSCGREEFGEVFINKFKRQLDKLLPQDQMATLTELSAVTIAEAYQKLLPSLPEKIYFSGGGVKNRFLMNRIQFHLPEVTMKTSLDLGWPASAVEGGAFALLAAQRLFEIPSNMQPITGAKERICLGQVSL